MPNPFTVDLRLHVTFGEPIALDDLSFARKRLSVPGIYFIREEMCSLDEFNPLERCVIYIGKASKETIFSRCQKHYWTIIDARDSKGKPKTNPGARFKLYRENRQYRTEGLLVYPGYMDRAEPYMISCAEEYLQHLYAGMHGDIPPANTKK